ncbi:hypothetical protein PR048_011355 [Dryococelus australis]|uniref:Uncharacterized protein n=1 Tax=Dryococelus australis TaxID=614101 RepID=A0ABQ9HLY4_9NEOP|nr:hypothetical protein PR048_011355 [Dryococelus australis]
MRNLWESAALVKQDPTCHLCRWTSVRKEWALYSSSPPITLRGALRNTASYLNISASQCRLTTDVCYGYAA